MKRLFFIMLCVLPIRAMQRCHSLSQVIYQDDATYDKVDQFLADKTEDFAALKGWQVVVRTNKHAFAKFGEPIPAVYEYAERKLQNLIDNLENPGNE